MQPSKSNPSSPADSPARDHLFDKILTPSDVGKLNRLVIPKQQAEKFFPLNPSSAEKGLSLSFEDCKGKQWQFRYSYWKSSQSYVITKGWSRFVKDKSLYAGDSVSFCREKGGRGRLFIGFRRPRRRPSSWSGKSVISFGREEGTLSGEFVVPAGGFWVQVGEGGGGSPIVYGKFPAGNGRLEEEKQVRLFGVDLRKG